MINDFIGEFMFHPAPLEVSGNTCSHDCCYCFANIRRASQYYDLKGIIRQINKPVLKTYQDALLKEGYPICLSNRTDPFSKNNYIHSIELARHLNKLKNGLFIQTKGGYGIPEFIEAFGNRMDICWYITITTLSENTRERIEPNAPTINDRFILAEYLKNKGYHVILAINPLLEQWMPEKDIYLFIDKAKKIGINDICTEALHLGKHEVEKFTENRKSKFEQSEIDYAVSKKDFQVYVKKVIPILISQGINVVKLGMPYSSKFYNGIKKTFKHIFPNQIDIINYAHKNGTGYYSFDDFYNCSVDNKPFFEREFKSIDRYLLKASIKEWSLSNEAKSARTLKEVMRIMWNNNKYPQSIQRNQSFRVIIQNNEIVKDEKNNVILYFDKGLYPTERIINANKLPEWKQNGAEHGINLIRKGLK